MAFSPITVVHAARRALAEGWTALFDPSQAVKSDRARLQAVEEAVDALRAEWRTHKRELDAELEAMEDVAETVERKRRRIAARDSKKKDQAAEPGDGQLPPGVEVEDVLRHRARTLGLLGE